MDNRQTARMANNTRGGCVRKAWKPSSSWPILIYFEFRSKPSLITVICMDPHSPNKLFVTKYCFLIRFSFSISFFPFSFLFFSFFFFLLFYVVINFYKNHFIIAIIIFLFFHENFIIFSCSEIFGSVPACSVFRVLSTPVESWRFIICREVMLYLTIFFISQKRDMTSSVTRSERCKYFNSFLKYNFRHKSAGFCCFSLQIFTLYYPWVIIVSFSKQKQTKTEPEV